MSQTPGNGDKTEPRANNIDSPKARSRNSGAAIYGLLGIGMEFVATICVGGAIGWYLDRRMNSSPWLMIGGLGVGFATGLVMLIRAGRNAFKD